jgi:hypothetical protein
MTLVLGGYKPTQHNTRFPPRWSWLRSHCVAVWPMWDRGAGGVRNIVRTTYGDGDIISTASVGSWWRDTDDGPAVSGSADTYINTNLTRIATLGLFAAAGEQWTVAVRARLTNNLTSSLIARCSGTLANRTFQMLFNRPVNANQTPRFVIRGSTTDANWGLDDGQFHDYFITWNGVTCIAYYDDAKGALALNVGTAAEETSQVLLFGARTASLPTDKYTGDLGFVALLDVALSPSEILNWRPDIYEPWRPYRQRYGAQIIVPELRIYAPRKTLAVDHVELWTDVEANGGVRLGPVMQYLSLSESASLSGEHSLSMSVALDHPIRRLSEMPADDVNLRVNQVLRKVMTDDSWSEHRLAEPETRNQKGSRTLHVEAQSILEDLGFRGKVSRTTADGASTTSFEVLSLPMETHIREFILPALRQAGQPFWDVGTLEHDNPVDMVYRRDTPLGALRRLCVAAGDLELWVEGSESRYLIHIVKQIGSALPATTVRAKRNLIDLGFKERSADQATRVYCWGAPYQDVEPSLGLARWEVVSATAVAGGAYDLVLADPAGGEGPIAFDNQFLPPNIPFDDPETDEIETLPRYHLQYTTGADWIKPIIATFADTQTVRVESTAAPPSGTGHRVKIVADGLGRENLFVDHPAMVAKYGVRVGDFDRADIPATDNLVPNPIGRLWPDTSPLPTGWIINAAIPSELPVVTRETSPRYVQHGGQAARVVFPIVGGLQQWIAFPPALLPHRAQGYLSFFVKVTTLRGRVEVFMKLTRRATDLTGGPSAPLPYPSGSSWEYNIPRDTGGFTNPATGVVDVQLPLLTSVQLNTSEELGVVNGWELTRYPLYGGTAQLFVRGDFTTDINTVETECIIQAGQITISTEQMPLLEGNGGVRLHQAANQRVALYGSPAPVVSVKLVDLAMADGLPIPHEILQLGAPIVIEDPDSGVEVATRVVGWTRDWMDRLRPTVELSNERRDISAILASRSRPPRHQTRVMPSNSRGLSYG